VNGHEDGSSQRGHHDGSATNHQLERGRDTNHGGADGDDEKVSAPDPLCSQARRSSFFLLACRWSRSQSSLTGCFAVRKWTPRRQSPWTDCREAGGKRDRNTEKRRGGAGGRPSRRQPPGNSGRTGGTSAPTRAAITQLAVGAECRVGKSSRATGGRSETNTTPHIGLADSCAEAARCRAVRMRSRCSAHDSTHRPWWSAENGTQSSREPQPLPALPTAEPGGALRAVTERLVRPGSRWSSAEIRLALRCDVFEAGGVITVQVPSNRCGEGPRVCVRDARHEHVQPYFG